MNAEERLRAERARDVGLFRYTLIRPAAEASLSKRERGALIRAIAAGEHTGPDGRTVTVGRSTLDRWLKAWKSGGFDALVPAARMVQRRTPAEILDLAVALKREVPARTAAQIVAILTEHGTIAPSARTLHRHFADLGLRHELRPLAGAFGRFEADRPNEIWVGDALHGPTINGRKAMLFAFLDDHTRLLTGYRWVRREDTIRMESALRAGIASRGIPSIAYADNGSPYVDRQFLGTLARLGIRLVHSAPGRPQGRGKIERFFRSVREQFLVEIGTGRELDSLEQLNEYFTAWVETVYHQRIHSETGAAPLARWNHAWETIMTAGGPGPVLPTPGQLHEAFLWTETRAVTKTATISLNGNTYEVDAALTGRRVELLFDPFDLADIAVRYHGRDMGKAVPHRITRHAHRKARPDESLPAPAATGIDYLALLAGRHHRDLVERISYADLSTANPASPDSGLALGRVDLVDGLIQPDLWTEPSTGIETVTATTDDQEGSA